MCQWPQKPRLFAWQQSLRANISRDMLWGTPVAQKPCLFAWQQSLKAV